MNAYSQDLREEIMATVFERGMEGQGRSHLRSEPLSGQTIRQSIEGKLLAPKKEPGWKPKFDERARRLLAAYVEDSPFVTLSERRNYLKVVVGN
jgi:hypothetical protein